MRDFSMRNLFLLCLLPAALGLTACVKEPDAESGRQEEEKYKFGSCAVRYHDNVFVHFAAYQDQPRSGEKGRPGNARDRFRPYCQDIPAATKTFMTVDIIDKEILDSPLTVQVTEHRAEGEDSPDAALTKVVEVPAKKYVHGVVEVTANFTEAGMYDLILLVEEGAANKDKIVIPLSVGLNPPSDSKTMLIVVTVLTLIVLGFLVYYVFLRRMAGSPAEDLVAKEPKLSKPKRDPNTW